MPTDVNTTHDTSSSSRDDRPLRRVQLSSILLAESIHGDYNSGLKTQGINGTVLSRSATRGYESPPTHNIVGTGVNDPQQDATWTSLFTNNRATISGLILKYIPPEIVNGQPVVQLIQEEVDREVTKWKSTLIAYFIGETPGYNSMKRYIGQFWACVAEPNLFYHEEGYCVIRFQSTEDINEVLFFGLYTMNNKHFPTVIPLWVKFPNLPISCWGRESLSRIASVVGIPFNVDECTTKQTRISFARMLIEVNITKTLPDKIIVLNRNDNQFEQ
ncbi:hypothetical protein R3W88_033301 [Solanum pinnatisectum]|uniref:DUF4283 domain-containing protein n=1 Tax=Solanum pinnatisectum TaxID=50273 RepID=A0AAV9K1R2_9SOLN|nr:hypothetical protein R3W88_033301 [Solanum pinnatisectum]